MGGRPWNDEDIQFVKDHVRDMSTEEIAKAIKRTPRAVQHLYTKYDISTRGNYHTGDRFGRLVLLEEPTLEEYFGQMAAYGNFLCDCGNTKRIKITYVVGMNKTTVPSCGCYHKEKLTELCISRTKYLNKGPYHDNLYKIFFSMKARCFNINSPEYHRYGGRGITICNEWLDDFLNFYNWAIENGYDPNLTLDRIDNDGNYEPSNCRWVTQAENNRNRGNNRSDTIILTAFGETKSIREWLLDSRCTAKSAGTICYRLGCGKSHEEAISIPSERG